MDKKVIIAVSILSLVILGGGVLLFSKTNERESRPLMGEEIPIQGKEHVPVGTKIEYNSNPPAAGLHYNTTAHAGIYDKAPEDGYLVHSLEHGAVILWYKEDLPQSDVEKLKKIFKQTPGKGIMTPRKNLDVPVALTSWGRLLKLKMIDEQQIKAFFETNRNRAPEQAPI